MSKVFINNLLIVFVLSSCSARIASSGEKLLFPSRTEGKWWIINTVTKNKIGINIHRCLLLNTENENHYVSFYTTQWTASDSSFYSGTQSSPDPVLTIKPRFPLKIGSSQNNSWKWRLKRKEMSIETLLKKNNSGSFESQLASLHFKEQKPFSLSKMSAYPDIWAVTPLTIKDNSSGLLHENSEGELFIRVITGKEVLFDQSKNRIVVWTDLLLKDGEKISFLLKVAENGTVVIDHITSWGKTNTLVTNTSFEISTGGILFSPGNITGKKYPLYFTLTDHKKNISYLLRPAIKEQELAANKSSLWMGAVYMTDSVTGIRAGDGNMYIFRQ